MDHDVLLVAIASIRISQKQMCKVSLDKVSKHAHDLERGCDLYPIDLRQLGDGTYTINGNGRHRYFAYLRTGLTHIPAIVDY